MPSAVRLYFNLAFSFIWSESYQEFPIDPFGLMVPYCGKGRRAFVRVVLGGKLANGSEKPAALTAVELICELRRVRFDAFERLNPRAARIAGVTELY